MCVWGSSTLLSPIRGGESKKYLLRLRGRKGGGGVVGGGGGEGESRSKTLVSQMKTYPTPT